MDIRGQRGNNAACLVLAPLSRDWQFFLPPQPLNIFTARSPEALFGPCWNPGLHGLSHSTVVPLDLSVLNCGTNQYARNLLAVHTLCLGCPPLTLLPVCVNVFSLTPWLLDFHTVQFSGSSLFFIFKLVVSFSWLCKEVKCIYLLLHLGQKLSQKVKCLGFMLSNAHQFLVQGAD